MFSGKRRHVLVDIKCFINNCISDIGKKLISDISPTRSIAPHQRALYQSSHEQLLGSFHTHDTLKAVKTVAATKSKNIYSQKNALGTKRRESNVLSTLSVLYSPETNLLNPWGMIEVDGDRFGLFVVVSAPDKDAIMDICSTNVFRAVFKKLHSAHNNVCLRFSRRIINRLGF